MNTRNFKCMLMVLILLASCAPTVTTPPTPVIDEPPPSTSTPLIPTNTPDVPTATAIVETATPDLEFEIINAEMVTEEDVAYKDYLRPGVNVKMSLSNIDTGWLPEDQLLPKNFCGVCSGWDNAGFEGEYQVVVLHIYSWDLKPGDNTITISAYGYKKETNFHWEPSEDTSSANEINPLGEFEIVEAVALSKDDAEYKEYLRPGVNVKVVIANLDTGLLPEDQLRPKYFCDPCVGWDNAGIKNGLQVVVLHYYSSSLVSGENTLILNAYGVEKPIVFNFDPSIHIK